MVVALLGSPRRRRRDVLRRAIFVAILLVLVTAGCAVKEHAAAPEGPFSVAILATTDTRGELEPCG